MKSLLLLQKCQKLRIRFTKILISSQIRHFEFKNLLEIWFIINKLLILGIIYYNMRQAQKSKITNLRPELTKIVQLMWAPIFKFLYFRVFPGRAGFFGPARKKPGPNPEIRVRAGFRAELQIRAGFRLHN